MPLEQRANVFGRAACCEVNEQQEQQTEPMSPSLSLWAVCSSPGASACESKTDTAWLLQAWSQQGEREREGRRTGELLEYYIVSIHNIYRVWT